MRWSLPSGRGRALVFACALALAAPAARAEDAPPALAPPAGATRPQPVEGTEPAEGEPAARPEPVERIEVLGRRPRGRAGPDATAAATVVEAGRFAGEAKSVAELVATAPGVAVNEYGGLGHLATVSIRGATADGVKVLLDGLPLDTAAGGGVDLSTIPREWIERIEVVRGAEGAHHGSGALGGVVNVVTRRAIPGAWSARATGGSFVTGSAGGDAATAAGPWSLLASLAAEGSGGAFPFRFDPTPSLPGDERTETRRNNASLLGGALVKASRGVGEGQLDLLAQVSGGRRELPGTAHGVPAGGARDLQRDDRTVLLARHAVPLGASVTLSSSLDGRLDRLHLWLPSPVGELRQRDLRGGARAEVTWQHGTGALTVGASAAGERLEADGVGGARSRAEAAAWASEELPLLAGRLRVAPGVRVDRVGPYGGVSGKLGAAATLAGPLSARASAGRSFRAPSVSELYLQQGLFDPNPSLRAEQAWSADAALVLDGAGGFASVGGFAALYRDLVVYLPGGFQRLKPFNDGKALVRGLEVEVATAPVPRLLGLAVQAAYTLLRAETLRGTEAELGRDVPHRPRHRVFGRVSLGGARAGAHVEAHYVGAQYLDTHNLQRIPSALSLNAGASARLRSTPDLRLSLEVKNLGDDRTLQDGFGNPLPGRMVLVTVRVGSRSPQGG